MRALSDFLRPEFLNRVDEIVAFNKLTEEHFRGIAEIMLGELKDSLAERSIALSWAGEVIDFLVKESYSAKFGARNLRRTIQKHIEDKIAERIIASYMAPIGQIVLRADESGIAVEAY